MIISEWHRLCPDHLYWISVSEVFDPVSVFSVISKIIDILLFHYFCICALLLGSVMSYCD